MHPAIIVLFCICGALGLLTIILLILKTKKKKKNPLIKRSESILIIINQRIHSILNKIQKIDSEITRILVLKDTKDKSNESTEELQIELKDNQAKIKELMLKIEDLKDYQQEIKNEILSKKQGNLDEIEVIFERIKEKIDNC